MDFPQQYFKIFISGFLVLSDVLQLLARHFVKHNPGNNVAYFQVLFEGYFSPVFQNYMVVFKILF